VYIWSTDGGGHHRENTQRFVTNKASIRISGDLGRASPAFVFVLGVVPGAEEVEDPGRLRLMGGVGYLLQ